jgi:ketosteroid isomerase-like protein
VRRYLWLAAIALVVAGCGEQAPSDQEQVRQTLTAFGRATAAKDYQTLCDRLLAPALIADVKKIGLPCEIALQQGLGQVRQPRLIVGEVRIRGTRANAEVRTSAEGQAPSRDTIELVKTEGGWRIASLATPAQPGPTP